MVDSEVFLSKYTRFQTKEPATVQQFIDSARKTYVPASLWGIHRDEGIMLFTAHCLEMEDFQDSELGGAAISMASGAGGKSPASVDEDLSLTTYGRRFKFLRDGLLNGSISPLEDEVFTEVKFTMGWTNI